MEPRVYLCLTSYHILTLSSNESGVILPWNGSAPGVLGVSLTLCRYWFFSGRRVVTVTTKLLNFAPFPRDDSTSALPLTAWGWWSALQSRAHLKAAAALLGSGYCTKLRGWPLLTFHYLRAVYQILRRWPQTGPGLCSLSPSGPKLSTSHWKCDQPQDELPLSFCLYLFTPSSSQWH